MPKLNDRILEPLVHTGIWLCLFFYPFLFHYLSLDDSLALLRIFIFLILLIVFFYANSFLLIPKLLGAKKILVYFLCIVIFITGIAYASGFIQLWFNPEIRIKPGLMSAGRYTGIIASLIVWVISSGMKITREWFRNEQLRRDIENEKLQAELSFLKTQVNPHFLFNALNNIYSLENKRSERTGEAILKLSELARYMLYETSSEYVPLAKEIEYLEGYIALQQLGFDDVSVMFKINGDVAGKKIQPMLLVPLVENAFKHGISYARKIPVNIALTVTDNELFLRVENGFIEKPSAKDRTNGIGLANLEKRLGVLYPGKYYLHAEKNNSMFIAELKLDLRK